MQGTFFTIFTIFFEFQTTRVINLILRHDIIESFADFADQTDKYS